MALHPVNRRSVPEDVFDQIVTDVLSGEMKPRQTLPSERRLAEVLVIPPGRARGTQACFGRRPRPSAPGRPTTVRDFRRHAGLDLLPQLLLHAGELDLSVVRSILEARLHNGPKAAEFAAERRQPGLVPLLDEAVRNLETERDPVGASGATH